MASDRFESDPRLSAWVSAVETFWQRLGLSPADRARLRTELQEDLQASLAQGASVEELTATNPGQFACELVDANGITAGRLQPDHPFTTWSFVLTALVGAAFGGLIALAVWYPPGVRLMDEFALSYQQQGLVAVGLHAGAAFIAAAGAMAAIHRRFRFRRRRRLTVAVTGLFLLTAGAASVVPTMALAASVGYSSQAPIVIAEIVVILAFCTVGLLLARWVLSRADRSVETA